MNYSELRGLQDVFLEDSFVEDISSSIVFRLDVVLMEGHALYEPPPPGERYCFRKADLRFDNVESMNWQHKNLAASVDASGERDLGNIDTFVFEDGKYKLTGDWGAIEIVSSSPELVFK